MVEAEHHESVGVGQYPFIDRQSITRLIDALEHRDGMAGDVLGNLLEARETTGETILAHRRSLEEIGPCSIPDPRRPAT